MHKRSRKAKLNHVRAEIASPASVLVPQFLQEHVDQEGHEKRNQEEDEGPCPPRAPGRVAHAPLVLQSILHPREEKRMLGVLIVLRAPRLGSQQVKVPLRRTHDSKPGPRSRAFDLAASETVT